MLAKFRKEHPRLLNQFSLGIFTFICCLITALVNGSNLELNESIALATGYEALFLVAVSLLIGPINMLKQRRNPVNINLRRDVGIWAGYTALAHTFFSLQLYFGGSILSYFFKENTASLEPQLNLFGISNFVGLFAALIILFLLVLSSNFFLKKLKGKRWKNLQRFNYLLFALVLAHTLGQQINSSRGLTLVLAVLGTAMAVMVAQSIGFVVYRKRAQQRQVAKTSPQPNVISSTVGVNPEVGRRRFITVAGAAMVTGFVGGVAIVPAISKAYQAVTDDGQEQASTAATTAANTTASTSASTSANTTSAATTTAATSTTTNASTTTAAQNTSASTTSSITTAAPSTSASTTTAATINGTVLATLSTLTVGSVKQFKTPDTKKTAFLVREPDGSVKAFSGVCTHDPFDLVYDQSNKQLYCSLHGACFNTTNGGVTRGPARTALASLNVKVDSAGNIVYTTA